jgi:hypothetical protein
MVFFFKTNDMIQILPNTSIVLNKKCQYFSQIFIITSVLGHHSWQIHAAFTWYLYFF